VFDKPESDEWKPIHIKRALDDHYTEPDEKGFGECERCGMRTYVEYEGELPTNSAVISNVRRHEEEQCRYRDE